MDKINLPKKDNIQEIKHKNIIAFLTAFKRSNDLSKINQKVQGNNTIFTAESQLPELWIKTRCPVNLNMAFYDFKTLQEEKKMYPGFPQRKSPPNFYPKSPFFLPRHAELLGNKKMKEEQKNPEPVIIMSTPTSTLMQKTWKIKMLKDNQSVESGPFNSYKIKSFLYFGYMKLSEEEKKKRKFMLIDVESDVHYLPETVIEYFQLDNTKPELIDWNQSFLFGKTEEEKIISIGNEKDLKNNDMLFNIFN